MSHRSNRRVAFTTLGCKVNQADTDRWVSELLDMGYEIVDFDRPADAYVVNTCTVTHVADRKSRQVLRRARRQSPSALVVATGCYASVATAELTRMAEIDLVIGGADKEFVGQEDSRRARRRRRANRGNVGRGHPAHRRQNKGVHQDFRWMQQILHILHSALRPRP